MILGIIKFVTQYSRSQMPNCWNANVVKKILYKMSKKSNAEHDILSKSDTMWFCVKCRKIAEEHIIIDLKIEKRCKEIMENYEQRISDIESEMYKKCDEPRGERNCKGRIGAE